MVTSPPDARYAPLLGATARVSRTFEAVRALVLPVTPAAVHESPELEVIYRRGNNVRSGGLERAGSVKPTQRPVFMVFCIIKVAPC